jgi:hypothetical protein
MSRISDAWSAARAAGASILSPDNDNLTADAEGSAAFETAIKELCGTNAGALSQLLAAIEDAIASANQLNAMNKLPTTDPKCFSKPIIRLSVGCSAEVTWVGRNKNEKDCS